MAYLALLWSIFGYSIVATRIAMLLVAALGALVTFLLGIELARGATGTPAFAALALLCLSPLFFAQSMLAQLDMPAMCLSILALLLFLQNRFRASAVACVALVLVKETGVVVPALFGCWLLLVEGWNDARQALWFLLPFPGLLIWLRRCTTPPGIGSATRRSPHTTFGSRCIPPDFCSRCRAGSITFSSAAGISSARLRWFGRCAACRCSGTGPGASPARSCWRMSGGERAGRRGAGALSFAGPARGLYRLRGFAAGALMPQHAPARSRGTARMPDRRQFRESAYTRSRLRTIWPS